MSSSFAVVNLEVFLLRPLQILCNVMYCNASALPADCKQKPKRQLTPNDNTNPNPNPADPADRKRHFTTRAQKYTFCNRKQAFCRSRYDVTDILSVTRHGLTLC